ncbi:epsin-1 isoform X2 [Latimeria chalumnae]|uniref:epsin-1 isoform X2 n=1 Tax=Latimeria chalumnae TaxID=7897 RepID=UPI00313C1E04
MSTSSLRRQVKNIVHNYSEAEIKVREATSNDPWGPSSSLMSEIADLTYNVVAFSEIMSMIWKRLNDHGKNWRHVYKAMTLMEYLIKTGSERVAQQCKENIYAIQTLKDFQYVDRDGKDQGVNVREKAKQLVSLLRDDDRLREERAHALKTKEKLAQTSTSSAPPLHAPTEAEQAWPQSTGEEELQLQLALAMSKEEAEQEERIRRGDDLRLQMAIEESKKEAPTKEESALMDLTNVFSASAPAVAAAAPPVSVAADPWGGPIATVSSAASDPWGGPPAPGDPWGASGQNESNQGDPWGGTTTSTSSSTPGDPWNPLGSKSTTTAAPTDPWTTLTLPASTDPPKPSSDPWASSASTSAPDPSFSDPWGGSPAKLTINGATGSKDNISSTTPDPWTALSTDPQKTDPWVPPSSTVAAGQSFSDPWGGSSAKPTTNGATGEMELLAGEVPVSRPAGSPDAFEMASLGSSLADSIGCRPTLAARKTPESFLGPNAALVDLDSLVSKPFVQTTKTSNPFLSTGGMSAPSATNPFQGSQQPPLTLNQLRASPVMSLGQPTTPAGTTAMGLPYSSVPPMVSVSPMAPSVPLAGVPPMVGVQAMGVMPPISGMPMGVAPGMSMPPPGGVLPPMMASPQMIPQPLLPNSAPTQPMGSTNPFLL